MKIGFVYGGQGSQVEEMGLDLYKNYDFIKKFYDDINLDIPLKEISFYGKSETLKETKYTQPTLLAFQIAITKILNHYNIYPSISAGLSLGEFASLYAAGILDEDNLLKIIQYRSLLMDNISKKIDSSMIAVITDDIDYLEKLCKKISDDKNIVQISNINTKGQIVLSGEKTKVMKLGEKLKEDKIRFIQLNTSGPFHTVYMKEVSDKLAKYLKDIDFKDGGCPIIHNIYGEYLDGINLVEALSLQVSNTVLFKDTLENIKDFKVDLIIEIGYGNVIKGFMKKIDKNIKVISVNSVKSIEELLEEVSYG